MSIVEDAGPSLDPRTIRWGTYALSALAVVAAGATWLDPGPWTAAAALLLAPIPVAITLAWPQLFLVTTRGRRSLNPIAGAGALVLLVAGVETDFIGLETQIIVAAVLAIACGGIGWQMAQRAQSPVPISVAITALAIGGFYGYGGFAVADVHFDPSPGAAYRAAVTDKTVSHGRSTTYSLELAAWGPVAAPSSVEVQEDLYNAVQQGDQVCLTLHPGALRTPWFTVAPCPAATPA